MLQGVKSARNSTGVKSGKMIHQNEQNKWNRGVKTPDFGTRGYKDLNFGGVPKCPLPSTLFNGIDLKNNNNSNIYHEEHKCLNISISQIIYTLH